MKKWLLIAALHNLQLKEALGNEYLALAPASDSRLDESREELAISQLITGFKDQFGRSRRPSFLLLSSQAPKTWGAIIDFRNAVAISVLVHEWANQLASPRMPWFLKYSEYFDLYPYQPSKDGDLLIVNSPSIHGIDDEGFCGQTSPEIATLEPHSDYFDVALLEALLRKWAQVHIRREGGAKSRALFRSLQMAFQAGRLPFGNGASVSDYGAQLALWASAHEILVWPDKKRADLAAVISLLRESKFDSGFLKQRRFGSRKKANLGRVRLIERLYIDLRRGTIFSTATLYPQRQYESPSGLSRLHF